MPDSAVNLPTVHQVESSTNSSPLTPKKWIQYFLPLLCGKWHCQSSTYKGLLCGAGYGAGGSFAEIRQYGRKTVWMPSCDPLRRILRLNSRVGERV